VGGFCLSRRAEADLEDIAAAIARDNPGRAVTFLEELLSLCERIGAAPLSFPARADIAPTARMGVHGNYLILFEIAADHVLIRRIVHGARRVEGLY